MAISTFDELVIGIGTWLERGDLTARAPDFIAMAEAPMNRVIRRREMETRATSVLDPGDQYFAVPSDFIEEKSFSLSDGSCSWDLDPQPEEVLDAEPLATGKPRQYAVTGNAFHVYPTPAATYTTKLIYFARIPALGPSQQTNWLLTKHPDVYLYGALTQAAPYLEDDTGSSSLFAQLFAAAISSVNNEQRQRVGKLRVDNWLK
jgi:hypothetical protein